MEALKRELEELMRERFPGSKIRWYEDSELSRPAGTLLWSGFDGVPQLERQRQVSAVLRDRLGERRHEVGIIFTLTPLEHEVVVG